MKHLPPFKLERYFARHEFNAQVILCSSDCESVTIADLLALEPGANERFQQQWLGYTESQGSYALRAAITELYNTVAPDEVLVHAGAQEAIYLFVQALLDPGDHVIVQWPCYQSLAEVARSRGCRVKLWRGRESEGWAPDLDELRAYLRQGARAVIINSPHNPTGYQMPRAMFEEISGLVEAQGAVLFSDEVYRGLEIDPADRLPAACDLGDHTVSLGVMSKTYGLAGLRIGWIATHHLELTTRMAALKDYTTICNSAPSEFLASLALRHRQSLTERNLALIRANLATLGGFFQRYPERFAWQCPKAGSIAFPRLIDGEIEAFCADLLARTGVLLLPGTVFDDLENHFRIGFGRANFPEAIQRLEAYLRS